MYADQRDGRYRYHLDPSVAGSPLAEPYVAAMDGLFNTYRNLLAPLNDHLLQTLKPENDDKAWRRAVRALALDVLRGILPAGTVSNVGVFGSPQALEQLVLRLRAHPLPEAREYAKLVGQELRAVVPDFVTRLDREDRGQVWAEYLAETAIGLAGEARELSLPASTFNDAEPVKLLDWTRDGEDRIIASSLFPFSEANYADLLAQVSMMSDGRRDKLFATAVGQRRNRRHRPGRGFEHSEYTFEIVSDYGAFRDLQRHRLLTIQWQRLTPSLGYAVPDVITEAGLSAVWIAAIDRAEEAYRLIEDTFPEQAQYLVTLGHKLRYMIKVNAREAMHLIELRTSPQGHASYRQICQRMHDLIAVEAKHPLVAGAMSFVGRDDVHLPRYSDERRRATATQLRLPIS
jgi:thymidylate synthase ThyX